MISTRYLNSSASLPTPQFSLKLLSSPRLVGFPSLTDPRGGASQVCFPTQSRQGTEGRDPTALLWSRITRPDNLGVTDRATLCYPTFYIGVFSCSFYWGDKLHFPPGPGRDIAPESRDCLALHCCHHLAPHIFLVFSFHGFLSRLGSTVRALDLPGELVGWGGGWSGWWVGHGQGGRVEGLEQ